MTLDDIRESIFVLLALATPGAFARVAFQMAIDKDLPKLGFPGFIRGGVILAASLSLAVTVGLACLSVEQIKGYVHVATVCAGFLAQDLFVWAVRNGKDPLSFIRAILQLLSKKP